MVYTALLNGSVEALNQKTGELVWKTELGEPREGMTATAAPTYYNGMIFIGPCGLGLLDSRIHGCLQRENRGAGLEAL